MIYAIESINIGDTVVMWIFTGSILDLVAISATLIDKHGINPWDVSIPLHMHTQPPGASEPMKELTLLLHNTHPQVKQVKQMLMMIKLQAEN